MNLKNLALPFKSDEIEWRLAQAGKTREGKIWGMCLAYISARAIMNRLDEVCGPENWSVSYTFQDKGVMCQLSIHCGDKIALQGTNWVVKEDGAEQTDIEAFKGGISSALKRAGAVWGIGRYLYGLESGFIKVVERGSPDARYGKTKDGEEFYWVPPQLPDWALPEKPQTLAESKPGPTPKTIIGKSPVKPKSSEPMATLEERNEISSLAQQHGWKNEQVKALIQQMWGVDKVEQLTIMQAADVADTIEQKMPQDILKT